MSTALIVAATVLMAQGPVEVKVQPHGDGFVLMRGGSPFFIRGAAGSDHLELLKASGGNSIRGWGVDDNTKTELDRVHDLGMTMTVGIWLGHKRHGFDYGNADQVARQKEAVRTAVERYKSHPAVLMWGLGNEMEMENNTPELWKAVGDLAKMVKELDPHHPVMTVVAEISPEKIRLIQQHAPEVDVLGVNSYGGAASLARRIKEFGWTKPYVLTEFGPLGPWERPRAPWGAAIEPTSTEKAQMYKAAYEGAVENHPQSLGSYAFLWGHKQETTPTWFGMFLPSGEAVGSVDVMTEKWTGKAPPHLAPTIREVTSAVDQKAIRPGAEIRASIVAFDPAGGALRFHWEVRREIGRTGFAGEGEVTPGVVEGLISATNAPSVRFNAPSDIGAYRLYVYVYNDHKKAATANIPFEVRRDASTLYP
ncbi:MAG: glycoside hydrolase family 2 TIM barrel-domain containing protein [Fimbriimonadaceae bacterium]